MTIVGNLEVQDIQANEQPLHGKGVTIVGANHLQNSLLASHIAEQTGADCWASDSIACLPSPLGEKERDTQLILIDAMGDNMTFVQCQFDVLECRPTAEPNLAIFNVGSEEHHEELASMGMVRGIFHEDTPYDKLVKGIVAIFEGEYWLSRKLISKYLSSTRTVSDMRASLDDRLTIREREILSLIATGANNTEIANRLNRSVHTVKTHIYHIFKKINVSNRMQAVNWADQHPI